ncbi:MAG: dockerin type I repeat-containing protein [Muribaculaceae bacterium]|nr:dockerin type I repeat-containing protein [Muribaculaceae bacterium]
MKKTLRILCALTLTALCAVPAMAQLNGTGYYRFRNADRNTEYISMSNDLFNFTTCIGSACGGLSQASSSAGQARALECAGKYLGTDIHMVNDADIINVGSIIYAQKYSTQASNHDYNLIGQGTSLLTLTTGTYPGSVELEFKNRYVTIDPVSGSGANTLYSAKIELKSDTYVFLVGYPSLGVRYLVDDNGTLAINASSSTQNAKWYIEPVNHFNVVPEVEFEGKYYTTLFVPFSYKLSGQVLKAYAVKGIGDDGTLQLEEVAAEGGTVPAQTPVILECGSNNPAECQLIPQGRPVFTAPDVSVEDNAPRANQAVADESNLLRGTYYCNTDGTITYTRPNNATGSFNANNNTKPTNPQKYVLGAINGDGKLALVKATGTAMPANKAWIEYTGTQELVFPWEPTPDFILGDVNRDKEFNITDAIDLINYILNDEGDIDLEAANFNQDAEVNITDAIDMINYLLNAL